MYVEVLGPFIPGPPLRLPLFLTLAECGFPSPADDAVDRVLDLNDLVVKNPTATYFVRARGDSMRGAGIHDGDVLVIDRAREVESGDVVVAAVDGELTVKRARIKAWAGGRITSLWLVPENEGYEAIEVTAETGLVVWGVVVYVLHPLARDLAREAQQGELDGRRARDARTRGDGGAATPPRLG